MFAIKLALKSWMRLTSQLKHCLIPLCTYDPTHETLQMTPSDLEKKKNLKSKTVIPLAAVVFELFMANLEREVETRGGKLRVRAVFFSIMADR